ncbi:MAG: oxidoreductase [Bdellovibrionota bacterium]
MIRVGIIGFGLSGRVFHAPFFKSLPEYQVTRVLSSSAGKVHEHLPGVKVVKTLPEILQDDVDLIINCAPNDYHYSYTAEALKAGKHVVVEKPFVNTVTDGEKLIQIAKENGKILTVFQNRRYDGDFLTVKKLLSEGTLGDVTLFESHYDRFRPEIKPGWREVEGPGTGVFYDLGPHLIDQAFVLFGKPDEYQIDLAAQRKGAIVPDYFHITLKYGMKRVILHSSCMGNSSARFRIEGTKGNFIKHGMDQQEQALKAGILPDTENFGVDREDGTLMTWENNLKAERKIKTEKGCYIRFYEELYEAITGKTSIVPVTAESALDVIRLISAQPSP